MSANEPTLSGVCPDLDEIERFVLEARDAVSAAPPSHDEDDPLAAHVSTCAACQQRVGQVKQNLELLGPIRGAWQRARDAARAIPSTIGSYRIVRKIGEGGMGSVFEAEQENPRRRVALKMIRPGRMSPTLLRRFRREMEVLGRLQHPGIAPIYEGGTREAPDGPLPYFVMELVDGPPLIDYARARALSVRQRLELMAKVCDAVEHAHARGVLHRDLKPGNILVSEPGAGSCADGSSTGAVDPIDAQPKVLDFGVARALSTDDAPAAMTSIQTSAQQLVGTIAYMSPEQVSGRDPQALDARSDVYSLGVILYELLAGKLPYDAQHKPLPALLWSIAHEEPAPLRTLDSALRGDVDAITAHALEKEPQRRYRSAGEMAADLRRCLRDEPVVARPPSTMYQLRKFARRNKALVGAVVAALLVLTLGIIGTSLGMLTAQRARAVAEANAAKQAAVNQFLNEMLSWTDPRRLSPSDRARGRDVTLLEALHAAAAKIDAGSLKDQPEIEAAVRTTIGTTYGQLGAYDAAEPHLRRALELSATLYGEEHANYAECLTYLATIHHIAGRADQAEPAYRRALELWRRTRGERSPQRAEGLTKLGNLLREQRRFADAEAALRLALELRRPLVGNEHADTARALDELGLLFFDMGKLDESERFYSEGLAIKRRVLGDEHPDLATGINQLGQILLARRRFKDAEPLIRQALEMRLKFFGEDNFETGISLNDLGVVLLEQGRIDEAAEAMQRALAIWRRQFGPDHARVVTTTNNLALLLLNRGRPADAEPLLRDLIEQRRRAQGGEHVQLSLLLHNLGGALRDQRKYHEAEAAFREALEMRVKLLGEDDVDTALCRMNLANVLRDLGRAAEAEPMYLRALDAFRVRIGENHFYTATARAGLGGCLHELDRPDEAEPHLVAALEFYRSTFGDRHMRTTLVAQRLTRVFKALGKHEQARLLLPLTDPPATTSAPAE